MSRQGGHRLSLSSHPHRWTLPSSFSRMTWERHPTAPAPVAVARRARPSSAVSPSLLGVTARWLHRAVALRLPLTSLLPSSGRSKDLDSGGRRGSAAAAGLRVGPPAGAGGARRPRLRGFATAGTTSLMAKATKSWRQTPYALRERRAARKEARAAARQPPRRTVGAAAASTASTPPHDRVRRRRGWAN